MTSHCVATSTSALTTGLGGFTVAGMVVIRTKRVRDGVTISSADAVARLRELQAQLPEYEHITIEDARTLRSVAYLDREFVDAAISSLSQADTLLIVADQTPEEMRREVQDIDDWEIVERELQVTLQGVATANLIRRHRLGTTALMIYHSARQLARRPKHASLLPYIATMQRHNRFSGGRKKKKT